MAKLYIDAVYRGQDVERGIKQSTAALNTLKQAAQAALGAFSVAMVVTELKKIYVGLLDDLAATRRLELQLQRLGQSKVYISGITDEIGRMRDALGIDDTEITNAYAKLIAMTGDTKNATADLKLALDLQASGVTELNGALRILAQARQGEYMMLMRSIPQMREVAEQYAGVTKSASATEEVLGRLRAQFGGMAEEMAGTGAGQLRKLSTAFGELNEQLLDLATGASIGAGGVGELATAMNSIRGHVEWLIAKRNALSEFWGRLPVMKPGRDTPDDYTYGVNVRSKPEPPPPPAPYPAMPGSIGSPWQPTPFQAPDMFNDMADQYRNALEQGWASAQLRLPDEALQGIVDGTAQSLTLGVQQADLDAMAAELQGAFYGAFQAARGGVDNLAQYMRDKLINGVLMELAGRLAGILSGGSTGGGFSILSLFKPKPYGVTGGQIGPPVASTSYQASGAAMTNRAWRSMRG